MKDRVADYIARELLGRKDGPPVEADQDLLTSGLLDSLGVMNLVYFIEKELGVDVPPEDVTIENFLSVDAIGSYLESRTQD